MCQDEQDEKDRLYGKALRLADKVAYFDNCVDLLSSAMTIPALEKVVEEMEARVEHQKLWQEEIKRGIK